MAVATEILYLDFPPPQPHSTWQNDQVFNSHRNDIEGHSTSVPDKRARSKLRRRESVNRDVTGLVRIDLRVNSDPRREWSGWSRGSIQESIRAEVRSSGTMGEHMPDG
jgi:hypothetical protein